MSDKKIWEADPLICPTCSREMRIVALIDQREVIERILRHLGLWTEGVRLNPARAPPEGTVELFPGDPFPDYPVTTLSRGTGLTWQHGSGHLSTDAKRGLSLRKQ